MSDPVVKFDEGYLGRAGSVGKPQIMVEDHGILTLSLPFDFGGIHQALGGYALDEPFKKDGKFIRRRGGAAGMDMILGIMNALSVGRWQDLDGMKAYALYERDGIGEMIMGVRGIGSKTTPFWIPDWRKEWFPEKEAS